MQKKKVITLVVTAVAMAAFIVGAVFLYDSIRGDSPGNALLQPPAGSQTGTGNPPRQQVGGTGASSPDAQPGGTESAPTDGQGGGTGASQPDGQPGGTESAPADGQGGGAGASSSGGQEPERFLAPDFTVQDADGNEVRLSDMRGKPVVLNFWASWCPPCKEEMPGFDNAFGDYGEKVHFMMVCLADGARETVETGAAYVEGQGYAFPVYFDVTAEAMMAYDIRAIPATYFIDAEGYLVTRAESSIPESTLRTGISYIITD